MSAESDEDRSAPKRRRRFPSYYVTNAADVITLLPVSFSAAKKVLAVAQNSQLRHPSDPCWVASTAEMVRGSLHGKSRREVRTTLHLAEVMLEAAERESTRS